MKKYILILVLLILGCGGGNTVTKDTTKLFDPNNNEYFKLMWNINPNSVFYDDLSAEVDADIHLLPAWDKTLGEGVRVAVIDDCFDDEHEDLKENIYKTYDVNTKLSYVKGNDCHGTEVASVIGAVNNKIGIIGIAPKVKLILISIDLENSSEGKFIEAFEYAKAQGADIINCSWGSSHISQPLHEELKEIKESGIITVFASGNGNQNLDTFGIDDESEDENVIGVGASSEYNDVTTYSDYGSNIDILAPGGENMGVFVLSDNNNYQSVEGTSFSSPTVAGVIALMKSLKPILNFSQIYEAITKTADKIGGDFANYENGFDLYRAYGKINAAKAINYIK